MVDIDEALAKLGYGEGEGPQNLVDLRARYQRLVKVWHPDRFAGDIETSAYASAQLAGINEANAVVRAELENGRMPRRRQPRSTRADGPPKSRAEPSGAASDSYAPGTGQRPAEGVHAQQAASSPPQARATAPHPQASGLRQDEIEDAVARGVVGGAVNVAVTVAGGYVAWGCLLLALKAVGWGLLIVLVLALSKCGH